MIDPALLLPYVLACLLFSLTPGPGVSLVVANALGGGLTILGTQLSTFSMVVIVAVGLETVMALVSGAFTVIKFAGAACLVWIGRKMLTTSGEIGLEGRARPRTAGRYVWQGAMVNKVPGAVLIGGGIWLALQRRA